MKNPKGFEIGERVRYTGRSRWAQGVTGTIRKFYPPLTPVDVTDPSEWYARVDLDVRPSEWPYSDNSFAPSLDDLASIPGGARP